MKCHYYRNIGFILKILAIWWNVFANIDEILTKYKHSNVDTIFYDDDDQYSPIYSYKYIGTILFWKLFLFRILNSDESNYPIMEYDYLSVYTDSLEVMDLLGGVSGSY